MEGQDTYILLKEATKYCNYSQEYLSLRARQGRLKSVKVGRKWATKLGWLEDYLNKVDDYNQKIQEKREKNLFYANADFQLKLGRPPLNLPIEKEPIGGSLLFLSLIVIFLFFGFSLARESFRQALENASPAISEIDQGIKLGLSNYFSNVQAASIGTLIKEYGQWIRENYNQANDYLEKQMNSPLNRLNDVLGVQWRIGRISKNLIEGYLFVNDSLEKKLEGFKNFFKNLLPSPKNTATETQENKSSYSFSAIDNFFRGFSGWLETILGNTGRLLSVIIKGGLEKLGLRLENGVASLEELDIKKVIANQGRFEKIEMIDKNNGKIYCLEIDNGNWVKNEGECENN